MFRRTMLSAGNPDGPHQTQFCHGRKLHHNRDWWRENSFSFNIGVLVCMLLLPAGVGAQGVEDAIDPLADTGLYLKQVSGGGGHTCGITFGGKAYCWGNNIFGQLGDGTSANRSTPVAVKGNLVFTNISAGLVHTCVTTSVGIAYCWGDNTWGTNGDGTFIQSLVPVRAAGGRVFAKIAAGAAATCALTADGTAYCWGNNYWGQLGNGEKDTVEPKPVRVVGGLKFANLSMNVGYGANHVCGITSAGKTYCWGVNDFGQLGVGTMTMNTCQGTTPCSAVPLQVKGGLTFKSVNPSVHNTCAVTMAKKAYCWGENSFGQLGNGTMQDSSVPVPVKGSLLFDIVVPGGYGNQEYACGVAAGKGYCWGANLYGQLGNGRIADSLQPTAVAGGLTFTSISPGGADAWILTGAHACGTVKGGKTYCWGANHYGQLGIDSTVELKRQPTAVVNKR